MTHDALPPDRVTEALEQLGGLALRDHSMESVLQSVTELAKQALPGNPEISISLLVDGRPTTPVSTGRLALDLDEAQYGIGYGPCLHAAETGELTEITDARTETRWPDYARSAWERGSGSSLSVPLPVHEGLAGALNVYAREPYAFDDAARAAGQRFAPYAAVAVGNMHAFAAASDKAAHLQVALDGRAVIDQAKGILMERYKLTADQAFQALAAVSMRTNRKVRDIADQLTRTGVFELDRPGGR